MVNQKLEAILSKTDIHWPLALIVDVFRVQSSQK